MAEIENIHCPICTQPIPSSWQNGLPPALATSVQRGVHRQFSHETDLTCLSPVFLLTQIKFADAKTKTFSSSTLFVLQFSNTMQSLLLFLFLLLADFAFFRSCLVFSPPFILSPSGDLRISPLQPCRVECHIRKKYQALVLPLCAWKNLQEDLMGIHNTVTISALHESNSLLRAFRLRYFQIC